MGTWYTADLHLGHANIIGYTGRPFASVGEMDAGLVERWNATVAPGDEVWVLGDVALGPIAESLALVGRLAGRKLLVTGNHDRCWAGHGAKAAAWVPRYLDAGFAEVLEGPVDAAVGGVPVVADHFPYRGDSHDDDRFASHRPADLGGWLLHGHVHTRWRQSGRMLNVGVDVWGGAPVGEDELAVCVAAGPAEVAPLEWAAPSIRTTRPEGQAGR